MVGILQDVYSFGMITWELLARELPFQGMTLKQMVAAVTKVTFGASVLSLSMTVCLIVFGVVFLVSVLDM